MEHCYLHGTFAAFGSVENSYLPAYTYCPIQPVKAIMNRFRSTRIIFCSALLSVALPCTPVFSNDAQPQAEILHWWSSQGEHDALQVFIDAFESRGGHYYDSTKDDETASREEAIERMSKGYPATFTQWNAGRNIEDFYDFGLIDTIKDEALISKLQNTLPKILMDLVTYNDEIIAMPLNMHSENWMWHSNELLESTPDLLSNDWQKFIELGEKLANKNIPLVAVGNQPWQVRIFFTSVFLGISRETYKDFYLSFDSTSVDSEAFKTVLSVSNKLASLSKSFGDGNWNTQIKAVAQNQAATNFMGDWAKGEFSSLGMKPGIDYGCKLTATDGPSLLLGIDTLILGKVKDKEEKAGQALMLDIVSDAELNVNFNLLKGSVSPYAKPAINKLDVCSAQVYETLKNEDAILAPYASYSSRDDFMDQIDRVIFEFWQQSVAGSDSKELINTTAAKLRTILASKPNDFEESQSKIED